MCASSISAFRIPVKGKGGGGEDNRDNRIPVEVKVGVRGHVEVGETDQLAVSPNLPKSGGSADETNGLETAQLWRKQSPSFMLTRALTASWNRYDRSLFPVPVANAVYILSNEIS